MSESWDTLEGKKAEGEVKGYSTVLALLAEPAAPAPEFGELDAPFEERTKMSEDYPGQAFFHKHNKNIKATEERASKAPPAEQPSAPVDKHKE